MCCRWRSWKRADEPGCRWDDESWHRIRCGEWWSSAWRERQSIWRLKGARREKRFLQTMRGSRPRGDATPCFRHPWKVAASVLKGKGDDRAW
ncbi:hypothetical protein NDU88_004102 [Pleurodeles waltl]|uniref:Uncharacterized protein n=1 Tax=Pleurodeles waltl TaxID=8319 RepID=A0AAV7KYX8_PLEWA|nr:hypothetical protein NDU88_004102 [Pleurodeles waltl]